MSRFLQIHPEDNVVVCLQEMKKGDSIVLSDGRNVDVTEDVPAGHKLAIKNIANGENVVKYGYAIGHATEDIAVGRWVHTHDTKTNLEGILSYKYEPDTEAIEKKKSMMATKKGTFKGFVRANGKVGIRNEIWIIPTVGCVNNIATALAKQANELVKGSVDEVVAFTHNYGCSQTGDDQEHTRTILSDLINHPNAGGVLVLGLGCENSNIDVLMPYIGKYDPDRVKFLVAQKSDDEMEDGLNLLKELIETASKDERSDADLSKLIIGLKCGGSDGFSGITANPLVGRISDRIIEYGGTSILTEVPEMFGAETILMNRCKDEATFNDTVNMINGFKDYFTKQGEPIYENPSPGNKAGGITTLEDKSLGCTQKSGDYPVMNVMEYGERTDTTGLNLLCAPGNDLCAASDLIDFVEPAVHQRLQQAADVRELVKLAVECRGREGNAPLEAGIYVAELVEHGFFCSVLTNPDTAAAVNAEFCADDRTAVPDPDRFGGTLPQAGGAADAFLRVQRH